MPAAPTPTAGRVRALTDALAHPGKTRQLPAGTLRDALARLHAHAVAADWPALRSAAAALRDVVVATDASDAVEALLAEPALARLERGELLLDDAVVRRYRALAARSGPEAGSTAAAEQGRAAARAGDAAERETVQVLRTIAGWMQAHPAARGYLLLAAARRLGHEAALTTG